MTDTTDPADDHMLDDSFFTADHSTTNDTVLQMPSDGFPLPSPADLFVMNSEIQTAPFNELIFPSNPRADMIESPTKYVISDLLQTDLCGIQTPTSEVTSCC